MELPPPSKRLKRKREIPSPKRQSRRLLSKRLKSGQSADVRALNSDTESHLLRLPPEIFLRIAHLLTIRGILNIRETCYLGRLKVEDEEIWREKFYGSYGLANDHIQIFMRHTTIEGKWMEEIKRRIKLKLWMTFRSPDVEFRRKFGISTDGELSGGYRQTKIGLSITIHPDCTLLGLIHIIFSSVEVDPDEGIIGLYPVKNVRFLRDHADSCLEWDSGEGELLVGGTVGSCIQEEDDVYHILVHVTQPYPDTMAQLCELKDDTRMNRLCTFRSTKWYREDLDEIQNERSTRICS